MDSIPHPWERELAAWARVRPLDWTSSFERTVWALTLGDRIFDLYAEPLDVLRDSRTPKYRGIAGRMSENLERLNRIFGMAGVGAIAGCRPATKSPRKGSPFIESSIAGLQPAEDKAHPAR